MLRFLKREYVELYPDLEAFADATRSRDWPRLRQLIEALPGDADACVPLVIAAEVRGGERFFAEVLRAEPDSVPARILLGSRLIIQAWEARTAYSASFVSNAQAEVFHERLHRADEVLAEAVDRDPANAAAWSFRVTTARGLGLGLAEARYRYQRVAASGPHHFYAQQSMLQHLCPKWGGDLDTMHAFARDAMIAAGPGGLSGALVPAGMIEHLLTLNKPGQMAYLRSPHVVPQLEAAATWSVMNPNFHQSPGWLWAHNVFAYMWVAVGLPARGKVHFDIADRRAGKHPWDALPDPNESYLSIRKRAMAS